MVVAFKRRRDDCPAEYPWRVENGNGVYLGPHSAYVGMGNPGSLEVPPGEVACCQGTGWLYINPPPGSGVPAGCFGTGTMISEGVRVFQLTRFLDYTNDCAPPATVSQPADPAVSYVFKTA